MNEKSTSYRFSLRALFLITLACALLLFEWKMWGVASLLGTLTTLVCGAAFVWFVAARPLENSRKMTLVCVLLTFGPFVVTIVLEFLNVHYGLYSGWTSISPHNYISGMGIGFLCLMVATATAVWMLRLMMEPKRSLLFPLLIVINCLLGSLLIRQMTNPNNEHAVSFGYALLRGYKTAMAIFGIALVLRWVKSLPTTRDDLTT